MILLLTLFGFTLAGKVAFCELPPPQKPHDLVVIAKAECEGLAPPDGAKFNQ